MRIPIFMIFQFFGIISTWATKALEDGKVTALEGLELVVSLAGLLGVRTEFNVSDYMPEAVNIGEIAETPDGDEPPEPQPEPSGPVKPQGPGP